ncbi:MAG: FAD/NAD(P)-binding protein [Aquabacterium sp.]|nr:FAD/NAD(P)-binding protein [Aquabacterium sp.]
MAAQAAGQALGGDGQNPGPSHVAIVGCGFTGTSALLQLVDRCPVQRITVFEASGDFGPGFPYRRDDSADYLLNNTTDTLCLLPHNRQAFIAWLRGQGEAVEPKGHLPRQRYGDFLADAVGAAATLAAAKGITLQRIAAEVTAADEPPAGGVRLHWAGGTLLADKLILATGRCPQLAAIAAPPAGSAALLVADHVRSPVLDAVPLDATCHVLGASLSAYDVVNRLFSPASGCRFERDAAGVLQFLPGPNRRRVLLCSRSGRLKHLQSRAPMPIQRRHVTWPALQALAAQGALTLEALQGLVDAEAHAHGVALDWAALRQPYAGCDSAEDVNQRAAALLDAAIADTLDGRNFLVDLAGNLQTLLWDAFGQRLLLPADEARYRQVAESAVLGWAAPCPLPTAERLHALLRAGALQVRHGVQGVAWSDEDNAWRIRCAFGDEVAQVLVNTTGALNRRIDSPAQPPLVRCLAAQGLLQPYRCGGVVADGAAVDMATLRAIGSRHVHVAGMWLWGPAFFTSSAFMMARAAQTVLAALYPGSVALPISPRC